MRYTAYADADAALFGVKLVSCGHIFADEGRTIDRPAGREDYLIFYIVRGEERFTLHREVTGGAGSFVLFAPHEPQQHVCISPHAEFYYAHFTAGSLPTELPTSTVCKTEPSAAVTALFEALLSEVRERRPCGGRMCVIKLLELLTLLERRTIGGGVLTEAGSGLIETVISAMRSDPAAPDSLDDWAAMCNMSKFHFCRVFRRVTGTSPARYRAAVRMSAAREMLAESTLSVSEIAAKLGFTSPSYFTDAFRRETGMPPSEFREKSR